MRKMNIGKIAVVVAIVAMSAGATANADVIYTGTTPLQGSADNPYTAGVVGTIGGTTGQGQGGWGTFQQGAAQDLLNLALGGSDPNYLGEKIYANTTYDYSGTVNTAGASLSGGANNTTIPAGWDYVIAKYDGQNAGYVLFYLGGNSETIPTSPANFWTTDTAQYGISGWTAFNAVAVPEPTTFVAGALLLLPFGASTLRILRKNRAV